MKALFASAARALNPAKDARELRLNADTGLLKIIACLTMLSDHMGKMIFPYAYRVSVSGEWAFLLPSGNIMRIIGRLAMPIFCYCVAVGCAYSRNAWKYALRMLLLGIVVQPLYMAAMGHVDMRAFDWGENFYKLGEIYNFYYAKNWNILFTLFFGASILASVRAKAYVPLVLLSLIAWRVQSHMDYGVNAIFLIALFYAFLDRPLASFLAVFLFMLNWAMPGLLIRGTRTATLQLYALAALPLIYLPLKRRVKLPKWVFYAFYPGHLLLIYCLQL